MVAKTGLSLRTSTSPNLAASRQRSSIRVQGSSASSKGSDAGLQLEDYESLMTLNMASVTCAI